MYSKLKFVVIGLLALSVLVTAGCKTTNSPGPQHPPDEGQVFSERQTSLISFGTAQNDSEGYSGHSWDSTSTSGLQPLGEAGNYDVLVKAIGPPGALVNDTFLPSNETAPAIKTYSDGTSGLQYGFYAGHLAFVIAELHGDFETAQRDLASKYSTGIEVNQDSSGDSTAPAIWEGYNYSGMLYKRGKTNTRIYLMRELAEGGGTSGICLLYIPNSDLMAIRNAWWAKFQDVQRISSQKQQIEAAAKRQEDQQKIQ